ncbi:MAG: hypothetical protein KZQ93_15915 [Candidatus Thiodiazotropha sp. (ex Monitilora ramsayi)]|nr:hypothetical protein [Candidatus Thiodiazotropha sp. (ex Monitilora ramsayi)]
MCGGVFYQIDGEEVRTYFPNPHARLPVKMRGGRVELLPWGRRQNQPGRLPLGGWARHESILEGRWDKWQKISVKLDILQFMEKDMEGVSHWSDVTHGKFIQGLVATWEQERRVYVVTITPELDNAIHDRWPRIIAGG